MDLPTIDAAMDRAPDLDAACAAAVHALAGLAGSISAAAYLARSGRLRSRASAGAGHVLDGVPAAHGIVGRAFQTGGEQREHGPPGTIALSIALESDGRSVGVLAVASPDGLDAGAQDDARRVALSLSRRIGELGGPPLEGAASRLARHGATLAGLEDPERIERAALVAALDLTEMQSALLLRCEAGGQTRIAAVAGPLAHPLTQLSPEDRAALCGLVAGGASTATVPDSSKDPLPPGLEGLRAAGAQTVAIAPLQARGELLGVLIVGDERTLSPSTDRVELLELVATQVASCLRTAIAVSELRHRAATDPLTGLGHRGTFQETLSMTHRRPNATAVALCDIDRFKELNDKHGHQRGDRALRAVADALEGSLRRGDTLYRLGGDEFAALLAVRDDEEALSAAVRMREAVAACGEDVTVSVGVAVSGPDEGDDALVGRADQALYRAKEAGRDAVSLAPPPPRRAEAS